MCSMACKTHEHSVDGVQSQTAAFEEQIFDSIFYTMQIQTAFPEGFFCNEPESWSLGSAGNGIKLCRSSWYRFKYVAKAVARIRGTFEQRIILDNVPGTVCTSPAHVAEASGIAQSRAACRLLWMHSSRGAVVGPCLELIGTRSEGSQGRRSSIWLTDR